MKVVCKKCGSRIDKATAYSVSTGKQNHYYCSVEEYHVFLKEKNCKENILELLDSISGITVSTNQRLLGILKQLSMEYSCFTIQEYLEQKYDYLSQLFFCKTFKSTTGQIKYLIAVLSNNIPEYSKTLVSKQPVIVSTDYEEYESKYKNKNQRKSLSDY